MNRPSISTLSCVIPAYNEAAHIGAFIAHLHSFLTPLVPNVEIIIVNDGSTDDTEAAVKSCMTDYPIRYVALSRNFGKEAALSAGIDHATGDAVLLIDGDFQHPVELVPQMLELWQSGQDMIYGVIDDRSDESKLKQYGTNFFYKIVNLGQPKFTIPPNAGDFRLMDRAVVTALKQLPERNRFMKGLYAWVGFKTVAIPFVPAARATGQSSFNFSALLKLASTGITSFSLTPLRLSMVVGAFVSICALIYALDIVITTLFGSVNVPGWSTLAVGLMFFSGVQLILIGIVGEYVGQIYEEVKRRPLYLVAQDVTSAPINSATNTVVEK